MKTKNVYIVKAIDTDGSFDEHPSFEGREYTSQQEVLQHIIDTEQRVSRAMAEQKVPDKEDLQFLEDLEGTEITIINAITFGDADNSEYRQERELRETVVMPPGGQADMMKEIQKLRKQLEAMQKSIASEKKKPTT